MESTNNSSKASLESNNNLFWVEEFIKTNQQKKINNKEKQDLPFVTLTFAQSIDGSIAEKFGKPIALSSLESLKMTHKLRSLHSSIIVGIKTVQSDNPSLTVRYEIKTEKNPIPIVLDTNVNIPLDCKLISSKDCIRPILIVSKEMNNEKQKRVEILKEKGVKILSCDLLEEKLDLKDFLWKLKKEYQIDSVMIEGGASVIQSFLQDSHLIDCLIITISPIFVGGLKSVSKLLPDYQGKKIKEKIVKLSGNDIIISGVF